MKSKRGALGCNGRSISTGGRPRRKGSIKGKKASVLTVQVEGRRYSPGTVEEAP